MNIKVEIKKILGTDKPVKAYANIVIDDAIVIHGVSVVENEKADICLCRCTLGKQNRAKM